MKAKKQIPYIWIGPIITLGIMLVLYAVAGVYPFGTASTAYTDGIAQYIPFLADLKSKISEGGSLLFTWHANGGLNFWSTIGYYLASPFNLIALLFPIERMGEAFSLITLIKPVFIALTFSIFLKNTYKKNDLSIVIFSVLWAMSGFMIAGINFISWYDAVIWFPLAIMGLHKLMNGESALPYALFLGLTIASNFYIGWMVCIFCVIYFVYSFISDDEVGYEGVVATQEDVEEDEQSVNIFAVFQNSYLLKTFLKFLFSSLIAGGFSAIFTLPLANSLLSTGKGTIDESTISDTGFWSLLASHVFPIANDYNTFTTRDVIFSFAGVVTIILVVAYFFTKGISIRKKIGNLFLIGVMWASILIYDIYFIWHGFGEPAGLMCRFAFIYSFILIKIAYEAFCEIKNIKWYGIVAGVIFASLCVVSIYFSDLFKALFWSTELVITLVAFIVIFAILLLLLSKKDNAKTIITIILLVAVIAESLVLNKTNINTIELDENLSEKHIVDELTADIDESQRLHFESQKQEYRDMIMYGSIFGYNALEGYSSLADSHFGLTITDLGTYGNRLNFQNGASEQTPVFNLLYPTNYYVDGTGRIKESSFRTEIATKDGYTLFKNNYTMPFMYTVKEEILKWEPFAFPVHVDNFNAVTKFLTGTEDNLAVYNNPTNFKYENCKHISAVDRAYANGSNLPKEYIEMLESKMSGYSYEVVDMNKPVYITFDSVAEADGMMYLYVDSYELLDLTVTLNGVTTKYNLYAYGSDRTYELGEVQKGDVATITIGGYREEFTTEDKIYNVRNNSFTTTSFTVDMAKFENAYSKLDAMSDTEMLEFSDTYVKAKVTSYEDGALYIPTSYDEGWTILIDGVETPLYEHESHILMTEITEGEHIVEMKYCPVGFVPGAIITGVSVAILIAWAIIATKRFKKKEECATISSNDVNEE